MVIMVTETKVEKRRNKESWEYNLLMVEQEAVRTMTNTECGVITKEFYIGQQCM